jgi:CubicO group peptidase (beta-lactamase class C family)
MWCSVCFEEGGTIDIAAGRRDFTTGGLALPHDVCAFGSATKLYTAVSVLQLAEAGKLRLDDHIADYIDPMLEAEAEGTTLHQLFGKRIRGE